MEFAEPTAQSQDALAPAQANDWAAFTAWGPAAARTSNAGLPSWEEVRALSLLASDPAHDPVDLSRVADAWLDDHADTLLSSRGWAASTTTRTTRSACKPTRPT